MVNLLNQIMHQGTSLSSKLTVIQPEYKRSFDSRMGRVFCRDSRDTFAWDYPPPPLPPARGTDRRWQSPYRVISARTISGIIINPCRDWQLHKGEPTVWFTIAPLCHRSSIVCTHVFMLYASCCCLFFMFYAACVSWGVRWHPIHSYTRFLISVYRDRLRIAIHHGRFCVMENDWHLVTSL